MEFGLLMNISWMLLYFHELFTLDGLTTQNLNFIMISPISQIDKHFLGRPLIFEDIK